MADLISIVVPSFNRGYVIEQGLRSLSNQTYPDREVIVVDDGSSDDTAAVVEAFAAEGVRYLRHERNRGVSAARNTGIRAARGELIGFLDSDDVLHPRMIERMTAFLAARPNVDAAFCDVEIVEGLADTPQIDGLARTLPRFSRLLPDDRLAAPLIVPQRQMYLCLLEEVPVKPSALFVRRRVFERVGYFAEDLRSGEDWEWLLRLVRSTDFGFIDLPLVRQHRLDDATHRVMREADKRGVIELLVRERGNVATGDREARDAACRGIVRAVQDLAWHYRSRRSYGRAFATYARGFVVTRRRGLAVRAGLAWVPFGLQERRRARRLSGGGGASAPPTAAG